MILLQSCAFSHLPRTGGTYVHAMVEDKILGFCDHAFHNSLTLDLRLRGIPVYGFVRDPLTWYESWYSLFINGSEVYPAANQDPTILAIGTDKTVDEVVQALCTPSSALKKAAYKMGMLSYGGRLSKNMLELLRLWQENDLSFYANMCQAYFSTCTEVGRFEDIKAELTRMLSACGQLTAEQERKIALSTPINYAARTASTVLSEETIAIIERAEAPLRKKYGYTA